MQRETTFATPYWSIGRCCHTMLLTFRRAALPLLARRPVRRGAVLSLRAAGSALAAATLVANAASCDSNSELCGAMEDLHAEGLELSKECLAGYQKVFHDMGAAEGETLCRTQIEQHVASTSCERSRKVKQMTDIIFTLYDHDGTGRITFSEFAAGLALIKASKDQLDTTATKEFAWRCLDHDHSGTIERGELLAWVKLLSTIGGIKQTDSKYGLQCSSMNSSGGFRRNVTPRH